MVLKLLLCLPILLIAALSIWTFWATRPFPNFQTQAIISNPTVNYGKNSTEIDRLRLLTWNIAYGYGMGSDGVGYAPKKPSEIQANLDMIAKWMVRTRADIVFLQEVDFASQRSGMLNQAEYLLKHSKLPYAAYATSWNVRYVPFPIRPVSSHFGQVLSGGVVLSRFPIKKQIYVPYPKPRRILFPYNFFYLSRYTQYVLLDINGKDVWVANTHLEAFNTQNRQEQAKQLIKNIDHMAVEETFWILAGDLNTLPLNANRKDRFADAEDDFTDDRTFEILMESKHIHPVVYEFESAAEESKHFTFPSADPNRQLDHYFIQNDLIVKQMEILPTGHVSDHLPIFLDVEIPKN